MGREGELATGRVGWQLPGDLVLGSQVCTSFSLSLKKQLSLSRLRRRWWEL